MGIGEQIAAERKKRNISQNGLASLAGISQSGLNSIENGAVSPKLETLTLIAKALSMSLGQLMNNAHTQKSPGGEPEPELDINTLEYALYGEARELDEDEKQQLLELAKLMRKKRQQSDR